jgi:hypothetical protein
VNKTIQTPTKSQFLDVCVRVCPKISEEISRMIGEKVWTKSRVDIPDIKNPKCQDSSVKMGAELTQPCLINILKEFG